MPRAARPPSRSPRARLAREKEGALCERRARTPARASGARGVALGVRRDARTDVKRPLVVDHPAQPARARGAALGLLRASARSCASLVHLHVAPGERRRNEPGAELRPALWTLRAFGPSRAPLSQVGEQYGLAAAVAPDVARHREPAAAAERGGDEASSAGLVLREGRPGAHLLLPRRQPLPNRDLQAARDATGAVASG